MATRVVTAFLLVCSVGCQPVMRPPDRPVADVTESSGGPVGEFTATPNIPRSSPEPQEPRVPLIRELLKKLDDASDVNDDQKKELRDSLLKADRSWSEARRSNSEAIRQVNRRVPSPRLHAPHVVLFVADDLGWGDLGCYGQRQIRTPVLDGLAAAGLRFTDFYAGGASDAASAWTIMTGRHTGHARGPRPFELKPIDCTLAESMWKAGYATAIVGDASLGGAGPADDPRGHGFDHWFGYRERREVWDHFPESLWRNGVETPIPGNADGGRQVYVPDLFIDESLSWADSVREHHPIFLVVAYAAPKVALDAPLDPQYEQPDWPEPMKRYASAVSRMDANVGRLVAGLQQRRMWENTAFFFTSDNGPGDDAGADPDFFDSTGPFRGVKGSLNEGGLRVPLIVNWPPGIVSPRVSVHVSAHWDLHPTLAELVRLFPMPRHLDGLSFVPELRGVAQPAHEYLYWEQRDGGLAQAARIEFWKGLRPAVAAPLALYDLRTDPGEATDIAGQHPAVVLRIERILQQFLP